MSSAFANAIDHEGRYGAFFEQDDETMYFYLLDLLRPKNQRIIEALNVRKFTSEPKGPIAVVWEPEKRIFSLTFDNDPIAVFDLTTSSPHGRRPTRQDTNSVEKTDIPSGQS